MEKRRKMGSNSNIKERYNNLDGIRGLAAICIVMVHMKANLDVKISGVFYNEVIYQCSYFPFLFMMLSAFSMCCGYYDKMLNNKISIVDFYKKRYIRILPFFAVLVVIDVLHDFSMKKVMEGATSLTLGFSLLPNPSMSVIGVAWTLGVIFAFYMIFPFYCFLISSKKKAIISGIILLLIHIMCIHYFFDSSHVIESYSGAGNIMFCGVYFILGGIIYKFRKIISDTVKKYPIISTIAVLVITFMVFKYVDNASAKTLIIFAAWICYAIGPERKIMYNKFLKWVSGISMEIYLCHMLVFRIAQKILSMMHLNDVLQYIVYVVVVFVGASIFATIVKSVLDKLLNKLFNI